MAQAKKSLVDTFANIAAMQISESSAGTIKYSKFDFPISMMDKVALIISRIEYWTMTRTAFDTSGDYMVAGLSTSQSLSSSLDVLDPQIVTFFKLTRLDIGTAASGMVFEEPGIQDYSNLPGGGLLVPPNPLYAYVVGNGCSGTVTARIRLYYTMKELSIDEYWQLVESRRIITS